MQKIQIYTVTLGKKITSSEMTGCKSKLISFITGFNGENEVSIVFFNLYLTSFSPLKPVINDITGFNRENVFFNLHLTSFKYTQVEGNCRK